MLVRSSHDGLPPGLQESLEVIVSELASNAVLHAASTFTVRLMIGATVRVEVSDGSPAPPVLRQPSVTAAGGRGLLIVDGYADRWGYHPTADGKVVWAEVDSED
jgi:anti-sigma regulatory factor (Ser/Thr protein kinase)